MGYALKWWISVACCIQVQVLRYVPAVLEKLEDHSAGTFIPGGNSRWEFQATAHIAEFR